MNLNQPFSINTKYFYLYCLTNENVFDVIELQCGINRDVGIIDCYRYYDGAPYRGAYPIIVQFKARREKEQLLWRSKDRLRNVNIVITDDIALRQKRIEDPSFDPKNYSDKNNLPKKIEEAPKKKQKYKPSAEEELFGEFF